VHDLLTGAGVVSVDGSTIVEGSTILDGSTVLELVELVADFELDEIRARWAERRRRAMANGVMVPAAVHRRLKEVAADFLVSESAVDAVSEGE